MYHTIKATKGIICRGKYAKLVYDQIPKIIEKTGRRCNVRVLDETRYYLEIKKLVEEDDEFLTETNIEELADIIEVIYALAKDIGHDVKKLDEVRCKKMLGEDPLSKGYA